MSSGDAPPWHAAYPAPRNENPDSITRVELLQRLNEGQRPGVDLLLIDLRRTDHEGGTIRGSLNLPAQSLYHSLPALYELCDRAKIDLVIWWCGSSRGRGPRAAGWFDDLIKDRGNTSMRSLTLTEGIKGWASAGKEYEEFMDGFDAAAWKNKILGKASEPPHCSHAPLNIRLDVALDVSGALSICSLHMPLGCFSTSYSVVQYLPVDSGVRTEAIPFLLTLLLPSSGVYGVRCCEISVDPSNKLRPIFLPRRFGPVVWLALISTAISIVLLVLATVLGDGMAMLAVFFLSLESGLSGYANKWCLMNTHPPIFSSNEALPLSAIVIYYPRGSFCILRCNEAISRTLLKPHECRYSAGILTYEFLSLCSVHLILGGVLTIANAGLNMQLAFAASYLLLNALDWLVSALPPLAHWDTSGLIIRNLEIANTTRNDSPHNFTSALWWAVTITGKSDWVHVAGIMPSNRAWEEWLVEAGEAAAGSPVEFTSDKPIQIPPWDYHHALSVILRANQGRP